jgi:hypothetical protein
MPSAFVQKNLAVLLVILTGLLTVVATISTVVIIVAPYW